jgi:hypothetical protein
MRETCGQKQAKHMREKSETRLAIFVNLAFQFVGSILLFFRNFCRIVSIFFCFFLKIFFLLVCLALFSHLCKTYFVKFPDLAGSG